MEDEIRAASHSAVDTATAAQPNFPARTLTNEELGAMQESEDFVAFVERSTKVLERALDQQYDILQDYALRGVDVSDEDEGYGSGGAKKGRRIKEVAQFWDERWSRKRMISDLNFSTKVGTCTRPRSKADAVSSPSWFWRRTPRTRLRRTIRTGWCRCGISTCTTGPSTFSTPSRTS